MEKELGEIDSVFSYHRRGHHLTPPPNKRRLLGVWPVGRFASRALELARLEVLGPRQWLIISVCGMRCRPRSWTSMSIKWLHQHTTHRCNPTPPQTLHCQWLAVLLLTSPNPRCFPVMSSTVVRRLLRAYIGFQPQTQTVSRGQILQRPARLWLRQGQFQLPCSACKLLGTLVGFLCRDSYPVQTQASQIHDSLGCRVKGRNGRHPCSLVADRSCIIEVTRLLVFTTMDQEVEACGVAAPRFLRLFRAWHLCKALVSTELRNCRLLQAQAVYIH